MLENERVVERLKRAYKVKLDNELLAKLGLANSGSVSNWRKRGVPHKILARASEDTGISVDTLLYGSVPDRPSPEVTLKSLTDREKTVIKILRDLPRETEELYFELLTREHVAAAEKKK